MVSPQARATEPIAAEEQQLADPTDVKVHGGMSIAPETFFCMIQDKNLDTLKSLGGVEGIAKSLECDFKEGIASKSLGRRKDIYGVNYLPPEEEITYWRFLKEALEDKMMLLLIVLGITALVIGLTTPEQGKSDVDYSTAWIDGTFIIVAVTIVILITTINDYLKGLKFQALNELTSKVPFKVHRDGVKVEVDIADLLVGDIVEIQGGTYLPADGIFIRGQGVSVDESAATGENDDKKKDLEKDPFILSGTSVLAGVDGLFLCVGVGENSFSGKIELEAREKGRKTATPLQEKLDNLADQVGKVGIVVAVSLYLVLTALSVIWAAKDGEKYEFKLLLDYAIVGVSIIVVAVPEGLPLSVVIALAYSMTAMMKDNNMVRSLAACETMGCATSICSDKTGTLTTNEMTQIKALIGMTVTEEYDHNGTGALSRREISSELSEKALSTFIEAICFNSTAGLIEAPKGSKAKVDKQGRMWVGNKTEQGMLRWVQRASSVDIADMREVAPLPEKRFIYPFQSKKKTMSCLTRLCEHQVFGTCTMQFSKGAPEIMLEHCVSYMDKDGNEHTMSEEMREKVQTQVQNFAGEGLRCIAVAYRVHGDLDAPFPEADPFSANMVLAGVCAIQDPVRDEVPPAVKRCQSAGVTVRMCTGDNIETAKAIGKECGIYTENGVAMEGPVFRRLFCSDEASFMEMLPKLQVLARCSPLDKQLLVGNLMLLGEVVAVTGDGTNDAPALKLADVGFAMNDGTDVAKKASKIILLDNNFVSVVKACKWGRNVNDNIRKFLQFQLTVNVVLLIITCVGSIKDVVSDGDGHPPLAPIHLLWANLIMDTMAALALSTENPSDQLLDRMPTYRDAPLISRKMWRFILGGAVFQLIIMLVMIFAGESLFQTELDPEPGDYSAYSRDGVPALGTPEEIDDHEKHEAELLRTVIFNIFIYMQVFNWFHARKLYDELNFLEGLSRSPFFLPIVIFTAGFQAFMVEVAGKFMETAAIGGIRWGAALAVAFCVVPWGLVLRLLPVSELPHKQKRLDEGAEEAEEDEDEEEDDYSANTKLKMVQAVRKAQRDLLVGSGVPRTEAANKRSMRQVVHSVQRRLTVIRALRGFRGSTLAASKRSVSGLSAASGSRSKSFERQRTRSKSFEKSRSLDA